MGSGDYYWGLYWGYYRDPFPHSLLSTREINWKDLEGLDAFQGLCLLRGSGAATRHLNPKP